MYISYIILIYVIYIYMFIYIIHTHRYTYDISIYQSKKPDTSSGRPGRLRIPGLVKKLGLLGITIEEAESLFDIMDVNHNALAPFELLLKSPKLVEK